MMAFPISFSPFQIPVKGIARLHDSNLNNQSCARDASKRVDIGAIEKAGMRMELDDHSTEALRQSVDVASRSPATLAS